MRKINTPRRSRIRPILITTGIVLVAGVCVLFVLEKLKITDVIHGPVIGESPITTETEETRAINLEKKDQVIEQAQKQKDSSTNTDNTSSKDRTITLKAYQKDAKVIVLAEMKNVANGTCELTIKTPRGVLQKSASVIYQPTFSSCAGFSVPVSEGGAGPWKMMLKVDDVQSNNVEVTIT